MNGLDVVSLWLADFHLLAALLLAVVLLVAWRLRQPARRMAVAKATLAALATLAVLTALPGWSLVHLLSADRAPTTIERTAALPTELPPSRVPQLDPAPPAPTTPTIGAKSHAAPVAARPLPAAFTWTPLLLAVYAAGSLLVVAWLAMGSLLARRVRRGAVAAPAELYELLAAVTGKSAKLPALLVSDRIAAPVALGVRRPAIILPTSMLSSTDDVDRAELAAVLAHEWSHLQNGDLQTLAASRLLLVLLWPQPLFWLLRRALRLDQETLADADAAALAGRVTYAERLLSWARQMNNADSPGAGTPRLAGAVGLWEGPSQLKRRIAVLLDERFTILRQCSRRWRWTCGTLLTVMALALSLVTWQPTTEANAEPPADPPVSRPSRAAGSNDDATAVREPAAENEPATWHLIQGPATVTAFRAGPPPEAPVFKKNSLAIQAVDGDGAPIEGVETRLYHASFRDGSHELLKTTPTDEHGEVTFTDLVPPERVAKYEKMQAAKEFMYPQDDLFIVALLRSGLTTVMTIQPGSDLALRGGKRKVVMRPAAELRGRVTDEQGQPVADALVAAGSYANMFAIEGVNAIKTDAEGRYAFNDRVVFDAEAARKKQANQYSASLKTTSDIQQEATRPIDPADELAASALVVKHPLFAVTSFRGDDIPGSAEIRLPPSASISGRVVYYNTGKPAVGVPVHAAGRLSDAKEQGSGLSLAAGVHSAATKTDAEGRYRFANLPAGMYDVFAQPDAYDWKDAPWASRGISGVEAAAGAAPAEASAIRIGPGGTIRGQLVDAVTGQPLQMIGDRPTARPFTMFVDGPNMQNTMMQTVPVTPDGRFEFRAIPGRIRSGVFVYADDPTEHPQPDFQTSDDVHSTGPVLETRHGETIDAKFPVYSMERLQELRSLRQSAFTLLEEKKFDEAIAAFSEMVAEDANSVSSLSSRAFAYVRAGLFSEAIADFEVVLNLSPDDSGAMLYLADLLATAPAPESRDGRRALQLFREVLPSIQKSQPGAETVAWTLSIEAAAHAELGDFDQAVALQERAVETAPKQLQADMQSRLELYRVGKPFRRTPPDRDGDKDKAGANATGKK